MIIEWSHFYTHMSVSMYLYYSGLERYTVTINNFTTREREELKLTRYEWGAFSFLSLFCNISL